MPVKCREREVVHYYGGTCIFMYHVCDPPNSPAEYVYDPHGSPAGDCNHPTGPNCSMSHDGAAAQPAEHAAVQPAGRAGRAAAYDGLPLRPRIVNGRAIEDYVVKFRHDRCWRYAYVVVYEQFPSDPLLGRSFVHGHGWEIGSVPPEGVLEIEVSEAGGHLRGLIGGVSCCITLCHGAGTAGGAQDREAAVPG